MRGFLLFLLLAVGLDQALGAGLNHVYRRTFVDPRVGLINYALQQDPDVLVLGSSRATHHVVPSILRGRLSMSVFNAGIDGQDFLYAVMLFDLWSRTHHPPKAVILHVDPQSLSYSDQELERISVFSPYFDQSETVRRILLMRGKYERLKYLSYSYRFNGKILLLLRNLTTHPDASFDGYVGLEGSLSVEPASKRTGQDELNSLPFWDVKLQYLEQLAQYCRANGTRLFLFTSPHLPASLVSGWSTRLSHLVASYPGVEFLDLSERAHPELFANRPDLFRDGAHLNANGAEIFSALLADELGARLERKTAAPRSR